MPSQFLKPLKSNYYKSVASSKFMKQYRKKNKTIEKQKCRAVSKKGPKYKRSPKIGALEVKFRKKAQIR